MTQQPHNLYRNGGKPYTNNPAVMRVADRLNALRAERGYHCNVWITPNQVENKKGKYTYTGLRVNDGEQPVEIQKMDYRTGKVVKTLLYNLDQTNFPKRYAADYYRMLDSGTVSRLLHLVRRLLTL